MKLKYGILIYVIKEEVLKVKENTSILKHKNTNKNMVLLLRKMILFKPVIDEVNDILIDTLKYCRNNIFHSFEFRYVYEIKFTNIENNEKIVLSIALE